MNSTITDENSAADSALLARFVGERDEAAFGRLVGRYEMVVMGAALRRTGDAESARDVAQKVYVTLARKAGSLKGHERLGGWMYRAASFEAARFMESERRRRERERNYADADEAAGGTDPAMWEALENAMAKMPESKREVIVMHYFQDKDYREMAADLGLSEAATRKRMSRALEDLGNRLRRSGVTTPAVQVLTGAVGAQAILTPTPSAAAMALSVAGASSASSSAGLLLSSLTSASALKATAAVVVLTSIPLALQWNEARAAGQELKAARAALLRTSAIEENDEAAARRKVLAGITAAEMRLATVNSELVAARTELDEKKEAIAQIGSEVVISHGKPEDLAVRLVPMLKLLAIGMKEDGSSEFTNEQEAEAMRMSFKAIPDLQSVLHLDRVPEAKARFISKLIVETAGLDEELEQKIEAALKPEMEKAKEAGLVFSERPPMDSPDMESWTRRYNQAAHRQARAVAPLLPQRTIESGLWQFFTGDLEEDGGVADLYFGISEMMGSNGDSFRAEAEESPEGKGE